MSDADIKQISRAEMAKLLQERCPTMSDMTVQAALSGAVLQLANGEKYQCPRINDGKPTHRIEAKVRKVGSTWHNN